MGYWKIAGIAGISLAALSALATALSGFGYKWGLWDFRTGFLLLRYAAYSGMAAAALCLLGAVSLRGALLGAAVGGALLGAVVAWVPYQWFQRAQSVPRIHDLTTDTDNPPRFVAILPLRAGSPNPAEYGGPELAAEQRKGYPDLSPLLLPGTPDEIFPKALSAATSLGWEIVSANPGSGVIEATDTTFWFGFKDDVAIRLTKIETGTRVDVRSVSRVGKSDVGTNAERIRKYLARLAKG